MSSSKGDPGQVREWEDRFGEHSLQGRAPHPGIVCGILTQPLPLTGTGRDTQAQPDFNSTGRGGPSLTVPERADPGNGTWLFSEGLISASSAPGPSPWT